MEDRELPSELFVLMKTEYFQGDPVETEFLGVFSTVEEAESTSLFLQDDIIIDPTTRFVYNVIPARLNKLMDEI